ncbi:MAG: hypothetical protein J6Y01_08295, partial [Spirochaetales bacterium]|nr:hypothetical protein [Spirochaetales bacterium]
MESKTNKDLSAIKLKDSAGVEFGTSDASQDTIIYTMMDTLPPEIDSVRFRLNDSDPLVDIDDEDYGISTISFGGTKNKLYLDVIASDANGIKQKQYKIGNGGSLQLIPTGAITITGESGQRQLEIVVEDNAGKVTSKSWTINIDNTAPYVTITDPGMVLDKTVSLRGIAYDANALQGIYISYIKDLTDGKKTAEYIKAHIADDEESWKYIGNESPWDTTFDTTRITTTAENNFNLVVAAIDINGNVGFATQSVNIDQDNDRPIIKILAVDLGSSMSSENYSWILSDSISGIVTDNDGTVAKVEVKSSLGGDWQDLHCINNSFIYSNTNGELHDGKQMIYFRVTDKEGTVFSSDADSQYDRVKIEDDNNHKYYDDPILYVKVDTKQPSISNVQYKHLTDGFIRVDTVGKEIATQTFGGLNPNTRYLNLQFEVNDDNGIDTVCIEFNGDIYDCTKDSVDVNNCGQYSAIVDTYQSKQGEKIASSDKVFTIKAMDKAAK